MYTATLWQTQLQWCEQISQNKSFYLCLFILICVGSIPARSLKWNATRVDASRCLSHFHARGFSDFFLKKERKKQTDSAVIGIYLHSWKCKDLYAGQTEKNPVEWKGIPFAYLFVGIPFISLCSRVCELLSGCHPPDRSSHTPLSITGRSHF